jgi:neopullulanase
MNYLFTSACIGFFIGDAADRAEVDRTNLRRTVTLDAPGFRAENDRLLNLYHRNIVDVMLNLLGSHDMARLVTMARGDQSALRLATLFQMTYPGAPSIYYGDEIGMAGGHDPFNRGAFPWYDGSRWDRDLLHFFQRAIALRRSSPALRRGDYRCLHARGMTHVHLRRLGAESVVVALNAGRGTARVDVPIDLPDGTVFSEVWAQDGLKVEGGHFRSVQLAPRSGRVFRSASAP